MSLIFIRKLLAAGATLATVNGWCAPDLPAKSATPATVNMPAQASAASLEAAAAVMGVGLGVGLGVGVGTYASNPAATANPGSASTAGNAPNPAKPASATKADDSLGGFLRERGITALSQAGESVAQAGESLSQLGSRAGDLVVHAMGFIGVPYKFGGNSGETGLDCSGFVRAVYSQSMGLLLPRKADQQAAATTQIERTELQPGDLVFFNTLRRAFSHVGIYVGNGRFVHAPRPGGEIRVESMATAYWATRFNGARRVEASNQRAENTSAQR
jgi:cell wall-associated NlpC family hydrolase